MNLNFLLLYYKLKSRLRSNGKIPRSQKQKPAKTKTQKQQQKPAEKKTLAQL